MLFAAVSVAENSTPAPGALVYDRTRSASRNAQRFAQFGLMNSEFESIFRSLRAILESQGRGLSVIRDEPGRFCLEAPVGPATLKAWRGKARRALIPVAWAEIGKSGVSYHLMGIYENAALQASLSKRLKSCMSGKSCFTFKKNDASLTAELEQVTAKAVAGFRQAGFIQRAD